MNFDATTIYDHTAVEIRQAIEPVRGRVFECHSPVIPVDKILVPVVGSHHVNSYEQPLFKLSAEVQTGSCSFTLTPPGGRLVGLPQYEPQPRTLTERELGELAALGGYVSLRTVVDAARLALNRHRFAVEGFVKGDNRPRSLSPEWIATTSLIEAIATVLRMKHLDSQH